MIKNFDQNFFVYFFELRRSSRLRMIKLLALSDNEADGEYLEIMAESSLSIAIRSCSDSPLVVATAAAAEDVEGCTPVFE